MKTNFVKFKKIKKKEKKKEKEKKKRKFYLIEMNEGNLQIKYT